MEPTRRDFIYDRLLAIDIKIEQDPIPRPGYINEKIWECSKYIEEVSKYNIELTRDTSVLQTALNNAEEAFRSKQETMIANDPLIASLPSIKDRVSRANTKLKAEIDTIKQYKNNLSDSAGLMGAVNLKLRNLNRINFDIRLQVRVLEAQIKLNALPRTDPVTASLASEMAKSKVNTDAFMSPETSADESVVVDPMVELNVPNLLESSTSTSTPGGASESSVNDLLSTMSFDMVGIADGSVVKKQENASSDNILLSNMVDPVPSLNPQENGVDPSDAEALEVFSTLKELPGKNGVDPVADKSDAESDEFQTLPMTEDWFPKNEDMPAYMWPSQDSPEAIPEESVVDLDVVIGDSQGGGIPGSPGQAEVPMPKKDSDPKIENVSTQTNTQVASTGVNIEELLDDFNKKP